MTQAKAILVILWVSVGLRCAYDVTLAPDTTPAALRAPLSELPLDIVGDGWQGIDDPLPPAVVQRAGVTEYVNRVYRQGGRSFWIYVGYVSGWSPESIHHPGVCFDGSGYRQEHQEVIELELPAHPDTARLSEYSWSKAARHGRTYTLSTFYYHQKFEPSDWRLRLSRVQGIRYFAAITISGDYVGNLDETRKFYSSVARRLLPALVKHFP